MTAMDIPNCLLGDDCPDKPTLSKPINLDLEVVTPMFLAGADQNNIDHEGLRPASLKGMLRWWWRANNPETDITKLSEQEGRLWGDTVHGQGLTITSEAVDWKTQKLSLPKHSPLEYLLGQGLFDFKQGVLRPSIPPSSRVTIRISTNVANQEIEQAIQAFLVFGGIGARSRRGWGSLSLYEGPRIANHKTLIETISKLLLPGKPEDYDRSTLCGARCHIGQELSDWQSCLSEMGQIFHQFRKNLGADIKNFTAPSGSPERYYQPPGPDHNRVANWISGREMIDTQRGEKAETLPDRYGFGLPYPMQFKTGKPVFNIDHKHWDRRASPLLLKVHKLANGKFVGLFLFMGGRFLPGETKISAKPVGKATRAFSQQAEVYPKVLNDFASYLSQYGYEKVGN